MFLDGSKQNIVKKRVSVRLSTLLYNRLIFFKLTCLKIIHYIRDEFIQGICHFLFIRYSQIIVTAWKVSKYGVFSGPYFPVFGLNTEIYGKSSYSFRIQENTAQKKLRIWTLCAVCLKRGLFWWKIYSCFYFYNITQKFLLIFVYKNCILKIPST